MSTRAIIARPDGDGFSGRYHHSDGYPTWLGRILWARLHAGTTMDYLLNAHPSGWSSLADPDRPLSKIPKTKWGMAHYNAWKGTDNQDACYCHGGPRIGKRSEPAAEWAKQDQDWGQEWVYVIGQDWFTVLVVAGDPESDGMGAYRVAWSGSLSGPEPDWTAIETAGLAAIGY